MNASNIPMQAMFLSKDAKDIARKTLEIDPEADVVMGVLIHLTA